MEGRQKEDDIELVGMIGTTEVRILVDTGSSHDFLRPRIAEQMALPLQQVRPFRVYVGNGESLLCSWQTKQTRIVVQNHVFMVDLHILPCARAGRDSGRVWLKSLRRVTKDFEAGTLEFVKNGEHVCLKLVPPLIQQVSLRRFASLLALRESQELFELVQLPPKERETVAVSALSFPKDLPDEILAVLESHGRVFGVPSGLPPNAGLIIKSIYSLTRSQLTCDPTDTRIFRRRKSRDMLGKCWTQA